MNVSTDDAEAGICDVVIGWTDLVVAGLESEVCWVVGAVTESSETASVGTENEEQGKTGMSKLNTNANLSWLILKYFQTSQFNIQSNI